jgi:hypothetical protein
MFVISLCFCHNFCSLKQQVVKHGIKQKGTDIPIYLTPDDTIYSRKLISIEN